MLNENMVKYEIKYNIGYVFKDTALKLNVKSCKYTDIHNDSKEMCLNVSLSFRRDH